MHYFQSFIKDILKLFFLSFSCLFSEEIRLFSFGNVEIIRNNQTRLVLNTHLKLENNDRIITKKSSGVVIHFPSGKLLKVLEETDITFLRIDDLKKASENNKNHFNQYSLLLLTKRKIIYIFIFFSKK